VYDKASPSFRRAPGRRTPLFAAISFVLMGIAPVSAQVTILKGSGEGSGGSRPQANGESSGPAIRTPGGGGPLRAQGGGHVSPTEGGPTIAPRDAETVASALAQVAPLAADAATAFAEAIKAAEDGRFDDARRIIAPTANGALMKYVEWLIARQAQDLVRHAGGGSPRVPEGLPAADQCRPDAADGGRRAGRAGHAAALRARELADRNVP
jgi:hypothetical protein